MERIVTQTRFAKTELPKAKRVAAYARVSSGKDAMLHSLSAQVSYYSKLIQNHGGWEYAGVYADEALTGTKDNRENFQRLLADCRNGKIDMILTKSVSRFARNTKDLLELVELLTEKGVEFISKKESIDTTTPAGKFMLTVFAAVAELERGYILDRQREGIAIAKANGLYKGRKPKAVDERLWGELYAKWQDGEITAVEFMRRMGMSKSGFYRRVKR